MVDGDALAFRLDSPIDHLLLDEFQDTAPLQWRVLRPLAERVTAGDAASSFFCVGDVKQAIYGWRGGVAEIFDAIDEQLPGLQTLGLNTSYRSAPPVIETVNRVFAGMTAHPNLGARRPRCAAGARGSSRTHGPAQLPGYAELVTAPARPAATRGKRCWRSPPNRSRTVRQTPGFSVGVLVRTNDTVAD